MRNIDKTIVQNILHYGDIGVHVIDQDRKTIVYNETMAKLEGLEKSEVLEKEILINFPSLNQDTSTLIKVLNTGVPILNSTQTYLNFKGKKITSINTTIPLYEKKEIIGALEIANDITHIRNLSDKLIDLQCELKNTKNEDKKTGNKIKRYGFKDIIGEDEKFILAKEIGKKAGQSSSSVLIYGETGTGKELFAQSIHYDGIRGRKPFIAQNCAAIPESLLEGILFGTEKGGFTGATKREGIFEQANGGTLMLDEINSMSLPLQAKLLRVLQEGYIRRIGGEKDIAVDVRIIATTNESPLQSLKNRTIRKDLFYRLNVIYIYIPSLNDRKDDIDILSEYFIKRYNTILNKKIKSISIQAKELFLNHDWPGNVRELSNVIEGGMNIASDESEILEIDDFISSLHLMAIDDKPFKNRIKEKNLDSNSNKSLPETLYEIEKDMIVQSFQKNKKNISKTAEDLGIKRQTLQHKLKKYEI